MWCTFAGTDHTTPRLSLKGSHILWSSLLSACQDIGPPCLPVYDKISFNAPPGAADVHGHGRAARVQRCGRWILTVLRRAWQCCGAGASRLYRAVGYGRVGVTDQQGMYALRPVPALPG
eukprot:gene9106-biopygen21202